jgi:hypothetical protein
MYLRHAQPSSVWWPIAAQAMSAADIAHTHNEDTKPLHAVIASCCTYEECQNRLVTIHVSTECQSVVNSFRQIMFRTRIEPRRSHPLTTFRNRTLFAQCQCPIVCSCSQELSHSLSHQNTGKMMHVAHNETTKCDARCPTRFFGL